MEIICIIVLFFYYYISDIFGILLNGFDMREGISLAILHDDFAIISNFIFKFIIYLDITFF